MNLWRLKILYYLVSLLKEVRKRGFITFLKGLINYLIVITSLYKGLDCKHSEKLWLNDTIQLCSHKLHSLKYKGIHSPSTQISKVFLRKTACHRITVYWIKYALIAPCVDNSFWNSKQLCCRIIRLLTKLRNHNWEVN